MADFCTAALKFQRAVAIGDVGVFTSRVMNSPSVTRESLAELKDGITQGAQVIIPGTPLDVIAFGCNSGTMVLGEDVVFDKIREARPGIACTTPVSASNTAFRRLGVSRLAVLTPYGDAINEMVTQSLQASGSEVVAFGSYSEPDDTKVGRISPKSVRESILAIGQDPAVEAVLVSCTNMRLIDQVVSIESELGKPVTSSTHSMAWHALRLAGISDPAPHHGKLFELNL